MKFYKIYLYCIAIICLIALEKNQVKSFPTLNIIKRNEPNTNYAVSNNTILIKNKNTFNNDTVGINTNNLKNNDSQLNQEEKKENEKKYQIYSGGSIKEFFEKTKNTVVDIYITMPESDYTNMTNYAQCANYKSAREYSTENANVLFEFNGESVYLPNIKFSLGGASSRAHQKVGYNIKSLDKNHTLYGIKNIKLRGDERDPTHLASRLSADFIKSIGLVAPSVTYSRLYINEIYMGLYTFEDIVKKYWIKEYFGEKDTKNCYKCETIGFNFDSFKTKRYPITCTNLNDDFADYTAPFDQFIQKVNAAQSANDLEAIMDIDIFLKYIAFEWIVLSWDHMLIYGHNFYWYLRSDGKWIPIYFDFDLTWFISNRVSVISKDLNNKSKRNIPDDDHVFWPNMSLKDWEPGHKIIDLLIHKDDTRFRKIVHELVKNYFNPSFLNAKIDSLHSLLKEYIIEDLMFIKDLKVAYKADNEIQSNNNNNNNNNENDTEELFSIQMFDELENDPSTDDNIEMKKRSSFATTTTTTSTFNNNEKINSKKAALIKADRSKIKNATRKALNMKQRGRINLYGNDYQWTYNNYYEVVYGDKYIINSSGGTRSGPLKWSIQNRFNYLCHTYGIHPETLELITPRPERRVWSSTNTYKLQALYDNQNIVRYYYPYLEKEDFKTNYCKYCKVYKEGDKVYGLENNELCILHPVECGMEKGVTMGPNGYPYCESCNVYDIKGGVLLGMENKVLCEILTDNC